MQRKPECRLRGETLQKLKRRQQLKQQKKAAAKAQANARSAEEAIAQAEKEATAKAEEEALIKILLSMKNCSYRMKRYSFKAKAVFSIQC